MELNTPLPSRLKLFLKIFSIEGVGGIEKKKQETINIQVRPHDYSFMIVNGLALRLQYKEK